jgi:nanoRNase/pAp phosphatase (c-di-AMP/oligoRNAs hydrolase)
LGKIAQRFDGGGHTMAAGARLPGFLENAKQLVFGQIAEQFAEIGRNYLLGRQK